MRFMNELYLEKDQTGETYFIQASQEVECMIELENGKEGLRNQVFKFLKYPQFLQSTG